MQKTLLIGYLGKDPEMKYTPGSTAIWRASQKKPPHPPYRVVHRTPELRYMPVTVLLAFSFSIFSSHASLYAM